MLADPAACSLTFAGIAGPDRSHLDVLRPDGTVACSSRVVPGAGKTVSYARRRVGAREPSALLSRSLRCSIARPVRRGLRSAPSPIPGGKGVVAALRRPDRRRPASGGALRRPARGRVPRYERATAGTVITRSIDPKRWIGASLAGTRLSSVAPTASSATDLDGTVAPVRRVAGAEHRLAALSSGEDKAAAMAAGDRLERRQLADHPRRPARDRCSRPGSCTASS